VERTARCVCGSLRAIASGEPARVFVCHCIECQRRTGSVLQAGAFYAKSAVRLEGPAKVFSRPGTSGGQVRCYFCPECGSHVAWQAERYPDLFGVAIGCFADPGYPGPTLSVWEQTMHPWVGLPSGVDRHTQAPAPPQ
jgi:hypothetical protein